MTCDQHGEAPGAHVLVFPGVWQLQFRHGGDEMLKDPEGGIVMKDMYD